MPHFYIEHFEFTKVLLIIQVRNQFFVAFDRGTFHHGMVAAVLPRDALEAVQDAVHKLL